jgi:hypothetical protein
MVVWLSVRSRAAAGCVSVGGKSPALQISFNVSRGQGGSQIKSSRDRSPSGNQPVGTNPIGRGKLARPHKRPCAPNDQVARFQALRVARRGRLLKLVRRRGGSMNNHRGFQVIRRPLPIVAGPFPTPIKKGKRSVNRRGAPFAFFPSVRAAASFDGDTPDISENAGEYFADLTADFIVRTSGVSNNIISYFPLLVQCHL